MKKTITPFQGAVYGATQKIPKGKVATYALIARLIGNPKAARAVGNALNCNPFAPASTRNKYLSNRGEPQVPCHRVVNSDGKISGFAFGTAKKIALLEKEGLRIKDGKIVDFPGALVKIR